MDYLVLAWLGLFGLTCWLCGWLCGHGVGRREAKPAPVVAPLRGALEQMRAVVSAWEQASPEDRAVWVEDARIAAAECAERRAAEQ